jgi:hypothetical protein
VRYPLRRARQAGFVYFLVKPADPEEVRRLLVSLAGQAQDATGGGE